ncbi:MAG: signal peptidase I [Nitrospira sp.]|nr:signal peptidase I [Nitrospira sp.]MDH4370203.1 signal peptidase I [Nitrospira sp.]MDH5348466.1 signal peptidase I [Nitrospira sp.]MDH5498048.1 signal peptidase I [Nitrospira sp.]
MGLWAGCSSAPTPVSHRDRDPKHVFQQLAHREVSSNRLYQAVVDQADVVGYRRQLELQSDLASPLLPTDFERIKRSFAGSLKVMLFDLAPADFWEQHLAEHYAAILSSEEVQRLVDEYERQVQDTSSQVQVLRQNFVTDLFPNLLPVVRARSQTFEISHEAMIPTFLPGDHVIVNRAAYHAATPRRGDVVLYRYPDEEGKRLLHRVIGLPGDQIEIRAQALSVNGEPMTESYVQHTDQPLAPGNVRDHVGPMIVPPDAYFVLGDNREESLDSRFLGPISRTQILGQVVFIYWSVDYNLRTPRWDRLNQPVH